MSDDICPNFKQHCDEGHKWQRHVASYKHEQRDAMFRDGFKSAQGSCDYCSPECPSCGRRARRKFAPWLRDVLAVAASRSSSPTEGQ